MDVLKTAIQLWPCLCNCCSASFVLASFHLGVGVIIYNITILVFNVCIDFFTTIQITFSDFRSPVALLL